MEISVKRNVVNLEGLDLELRAALGDQFHGASFDGENVGLYFSDEIEREQIELASQITAQHDSSRFTVRQQEVVERKARLEQLRGQNKVLLDLKLYELADPPIRQLAEKIAWLELELAERQ